MKFITHEDILDLDILPTQCLEWVSEIIESKEQSVLKPKISMPFENSGFYNTMPAMLPHKQTVGVKVVNRYANRRPSLDSQLLLYDLATGKFLALLDANYITTMRTGAVAAHSIRLLAKQDFFEIGMIGLGNTARAAFIMLMESFPERKFQVKLKAYKDQHRQFIETFQRYQPRVEFMACETNEEVVRGSDVIISSVTYSDGILCPDDCFKEGCLVVPIHTRGFQNCDLFFDKVFADDYGHVKHFQYFDRFRSFGEVSGVVTNKITGRDNNTQRILVYNIGIAIHDIYFENL